MIYMTFLGGVLGLLPVLFLVEKAPKHPLKKSYRSYFRRAQIRWVIWRSSSPKSLKKMSKNGFFLETFRTHLETFFRLLGPEGPRTFSDFWGLGPFLTNSEDFSGFSSLFSAKQRRGPEGQKSAQIFSDDCARVAERDLKPPFATRIKPPT